MDMALTDSEFSWFFKLKNLISKKPKNIRLIINMLGDGNVSVLSKEHKEFTKHQSNWISEVNQHISDIPSSIWLLANIDGWNVGKGRPTMYSYSTVTTGGASGGCTDDFHDFYIESIPVDDIGDFDFGELEESHEIGEIKGSTDGLEVNDVSGFPSLR